jgi:RND family efflux transporter MFP subunit
MNEKGIRSMTKYIGIAVCAAAIVCSSGCQGAKKQEQKVEAKIVNVEVVTATPSTYREFISLPVIVSPYREASVGLVSGGRVTKLYADKGQRVTEGMVLLETETEILRASLELASSNLNFQKSEYARNKQLFDQGNITPAVFDGAKLALAQAQSQFDIATKQLANSKLESPFDGIVTARNVEVGDVLGPAAPAFRIIDIDRVKVQAGIPEKYIGDFRTGNSVFIRFDSLPGREFEGKINYIAPEASSQVRSFIAEMIVDNRQGLIKAGIMGNAQILKKIHTDALMIPLDAVIQTQKGRIVYVLKPDDTAEDHPVEVGPAGDSLIMIETGLAPGDRVVVKGQHEIGSGEKVKVIAGNAAPASEEKGK